MSYIRGTGTLLNQVSNFQFDGLETFYRPAVRTAFVEGSSISDFKAFIRTKPAIEIHSLVEQPGSPELYEGVEASPTFEWIPSAYPSEQGKIYYTVYKYDDQQGKNPVFLGGTVI